MKTLNETIKLNFGETPFVFNIQNYCVNQFKNKIPDIFSYKSKLSEVDYIIREYMVHSGYSKTFKILDKETSNSNIYKMKIQENQCLLNILRKGSENDLRDKEEDYFLSYRKISEELENKELLNKPEEFRNRGLSILLERKFNEDNFDIDMIDASALNNEEIDDDNIKAEDMMNKYGSNNNENPKTIKKYSTNNINNTSNINNKQGIQSSNIYLLINYLEERNSKYT